MPLNPAILSSELIRIFRSKFKDPFVIAQQQAEAYALYARDASAGGTFPAFLGTEVDLLKPILYAAIAVPAVGNPVTYATAWSVALTTFWFLPPIAFAGLTATGLSAAPIGAAVLVPAIAAVVAVPIPAEMSAVGIAAALHTATLSVTVTGLTSGSQPFSAPLL